MPEITVNVEQNVWRINVELPYGQAGSVQGYVEGVMTQGGAPISRVAPGEGVSITATTPINRPIDVTPEVTAAVETLRNAVLSWLTEDVEAAKGLQVATATKPAAPTAPVAPAAPASSPTITKIEGKK